MHLLSALDGSKLEEVVIFGSLVLATLKMAIGVSRPYHHTIEKS
jgi:hypothetical protein